MASGYALTVGLNRVDSAYYQGWPGVLHGAENDAAAMADLVGQRGFKPVVSLRGSAATCTRLLSEIHVAAERLVAGDLFFLGFSGHGRQFDDRGNDPDDEEPDGLDETWCLYDGQLLDDEIRQALSAFRDGVRVVVVSDSCHSATVIQLAPGSRAARSPNGHSRSTRLATSTAVTKAMPRDVEQRVDAAHRSCCSLLFRRLVASTTSPQARVLLLAACADDQEAADGNPHGLFTQALLRVWNDGAFTGTYDELRSAISQETPSSQTPRILTMGGQPSLEDERAFSV
jgi:hypothetical protein